MTKLDTNYTTNAEYALWTPSFDLSDTSINYKLSFYHKRHSTQNNAHKFLEYSIDGGASWQLLNISGFKGDWQNSSGWSNNHTSSFLYSRISLRNIQGNSNVLFRFRQKTFFMPGEGWLIDDFKIEPETINLYALQGDTVFTTQFCDSIEVTSTVGYNNDYSFGMPNTTH